MPSFIDSRTFLLNGGQINPEASYVMYWMQMYRRSTHNYALSKAIEFANDLRLPLVVYEGLSYNYPWASDRLHTFILEGVEEKKKAFDKMGIRYVFYLQQDQNSAKAIVLKLAESAAALFTDDFPCFIVPQNNKRISEQLAIPVFAVDSNGIIPVSCLPKEEYAARTIRPKIHRLLPEFPDELVMPALLVRQPQLELECPETAVSKLLIPKLVAGSAINHSVAPSEGYHGGEMAAGNRLDYFIENILPFYNELRNKPETDGSSRLSPWLHFGFISAQQIYHAVLAAVAPQEAKDVFLEELIIRRELSFNFTAHNPRYDSLDSLPDWVKKTMAKHARDERPKLYSHSQIEAGETSDLLWNATQHELVRTGALHNYMRMLWGKKIIEWTASYEEAFDLMVHLNNKYALDGRDPNSYAGLLWCFGKHDRAWGPERPVFGTLRYLSSKNWWKKVAAKTYIKTWSGIEAAHYQDAY